LGILLGLNVNVSDSQLRDRELKEHRNRIWWTSYILDRISASRLGEPASVHDDDIEVDLPSDEALQTQSGASDDPRYLIAWIQLAKLSRRIITYIYGRKVQTPFSQRVLQTLQDLRNWVEELPQDLQLSPEGQATSNHVVSLHLSFNQV
jgi:proline utilization trans-activator